MSNILVQQLSQTLQKHNLDVEVKKETNTLIHCYLYDLDDYWSVHGGFAKDYSHCKKLDVKYKKTDLYAIITNNNLDSFCKNERNNYDMANKLNMLRR